MFCGQRPTGRRVRSSRGWCHGGYKPLIHALPQECVQGFGRDLAGERILPVRAQSKLAVLIGQYMNTRGTQGELLYILKAPRPGVMRRAGEPQALLVHNQRARTSVAKM